MKFWNFTWRGAPKKEFHGPVTLASPVCLPLDSFKGLAAHWRLGTCIEEFCLTLPSSKLLPDPVLRNLF